MQPARSIGLLALSLVMPVLRGAGVSGSYTGAGVCARCHAAQADRQRLSAHSAALFRTQDHPLASSFAGGKTLLRPPSWRFGFVNVGGALHTRITDGTGLMDLPMEWAFGAGRQAVTFVTRVNKDAYVEHYASWYTALHGWAATPGQDAIRPASLPQAAGVLYPVSDPVTGVAGCFECHSTGPVSFDAEGNVQLTESGVHCEACHGPGAAHAAKPRTVKIRNPGALSAVQLNQFCGRCHRLPAAPGTVTDWNYAWNVRHQPVYLSESACFQKSGGKLSCLTCHDPHEVVAKRPAGFYNNICMNCHGTSAPPPVMACLKQQPANCIDCHMPLVSPQPPLRFTNHRIGVYGDGAKLKPIR